MVEQNKPGIKVINAVELEAYLQKAAHDYRCPICKANEFILAYVADVEGGPALPYQLIARLGPDIQTFAVSPLVCASCGHTALFSHKIIGDKIHGNSK